tara:strand:+ start:240 stop:2855 length:2616 start_codon:yes stop_codon:yes gene_type:complete
MGDEIAKEIIYNNSHGALSVYERLSTHNVTSDTSTVDINIDYSFDDFYIVYNGVKFDNTGNERFTCTFLDKANTELNSGHYQYSYENSTTDGSKRANYANTENNITLSKTVKSGSPSTGQIKINHMTGYKNSGDKYVSMDYHTQSKYDTHFSNITGSALINHNIRLKSIRFKFETSQITAGTFTLYTIRTGNHSNADDDVWDRIEVHDITSATAKIDLDIISDYDNYLVYFDGIARGTDVDTNDDEFYITGESNNGVITGNNYMYTFNEIKSDGDYNVFYANDEVNIPITKYVKDGNFFNGTLMINNKNTIDLSGNNTTFDFSTQSRTDKLTSCRGSAMISHADKITKLNCRFTNNQISGGKITLFGLRNIHPPSSWSFTKDISGNDSLVFNGNVGIGVNAPTNKLEIDGGNLIVNNGNVGIGTSNPLTELHINNAGNPKIRLSDNQSRWATGYLQFCMNGPATEYGQGQYTDVQITGNENGIEFQSQKNNETSVNMLKVATNGYVGIGTTAPLCSLYNYEDKSSGWAGMSYFGNNTSGVVAGAFANVAFLGGHNGALNAWTNLAINPDGGRVGIGTTDPKGALHIVGGPVGTFNPATDLADGSSKTWGSYYFGSLGTTGNWYHTGAYGAATGLVVEYNVMAGVYHIFSDKRIKTEIEDVPDNLALSQVNNLECKYYNYKDVRQKRQNKVIGFIAQEVKDVIPNAVSINFGFIPDEMRLVSEPQWSENINDSKWQLTISDLDLSGNHSGNCRFYVSNDPSGNDEIMIDVMVEEDKQSFIFDKNWNNVFLWGKEVDDFHSIDKNMIFALHHSAIQELSRKNDAKTERINVLEENNQELTQKYNTLETKYNTLETKNAQLKSDIALIKQQLGL